jgi:hypothetical protein
MTRSSIIGLMALLLAACASIPEAEIITSLAAASPVSEELECMSDCLDGADSTGESCVARCL